MIEITANNCIMFFFFSFYAASQHIWKWGCAMVNNICEYLCFPPTRHTSVSYHSTQTGLMPHCVQKAGAMERPGSPEWCPLSIKVFKESSTKPKYSINGLQAIKPVAITDCSRQNSMQTENISKYNVCLFGYQTALFYYSVFHIS